MTRRKRCAEEFKSFTPANGSNAARHAIIDEHLRRAIAEDPQATIVIIGAGFDTRAFRLRGGQWFEFDEPEILTYKESRLPAGEAPNPLRRIAIEFARERLADKLALIAAPSSVHIIVEGVLMYLSHEQRLSLLNTLADRFPHHTIYCDLMRKNFFEKYSRDIHEKIVGMGATFTDMEETAGTPVHGKRLRDAGNRFGAALRRRAREHRHSCLRDPLLPRHPSRGLRNRGVPPMMDEAQERLHNVALCLGDL